MNRRPPWLSREDAKMLMSLEPDARRAMGRLLHEQAREQRKFDSLIESSEFSELERQHGERRARTSHGSGGGRHRRTAEPTP